MSVNQTVLFGPAAMASGSAPELKPSVSVSGLKEGVGAFVGVDLGDGVGDDVAGADDVGVGLIVGVGAGVGLSRVRALPGPGVSHDPWGAEPLREYPSQMVEDGLSLSGGVSEEEEPAPPHAVSVHTIATKHVAPKTLQRNTIWPSLTVSSSRSIRRCRFGWAYRTDII